MTAWICRTCGTQYPASAKPPAACPICDDERQYVGPQGQRWTSLERLAADGVRSALREQETGLLGVGTEPGVGIGQRALLVAHPDGNVLWDCVGFLDEQAEEAIRARGGIRTIAISHPHFYTAMVDWAERFDARILIHADDHQWVMRASDRITFWTGDSYSLGVGLTVVRLGGHFPGSAVLHWAAGAGRKGALLTGDTIQVVSDTRWVSFMYSYPNLIPLPAAEVQRIADAIAPYPFDRVYGGWFDRVVAADGAAAVQRSAERYVHALTPSDVTASNNVAAPSAPPNAMSSRPTR